MHRPLEVPLWTRITQFVRGLLFYNTVYWRRASDELKPRRLSRQERESFQPTPDLSIIRPREKPRASLEAADQEPVEEDRTSKAFRHLAAVRAAKSELLPEHEDPPVAPGVLSVPDDSSIETPETPQVMKRRRRYRRKRISSSEMSRDAVGVALVNFFVSPFRRKKK